MARTIQGRKLRKKIARTSGNRQDLEMTKNISEKAAMEQNTQRLRLAIDFGTDQIKMSYLVIDGGRKPVSGDVKPITFRNEDVCAPAGIAFDEERNMFWGFEAQEMLQNSGINDDGRLCEERHIRLVKMAIWNPDSRMGQTALGRIEALGLTLFEVLVEYFRQLVQHARTKVRAASIGSLRTRIDQMDVEALICVPQVWNVAAIRLLLHVAAESGIVSVRPVFEPECAAAFAVQYRNPGLQQGDCLIICDVGGGTGDFLALSMTKVPFVGVKTPVKVIGHPEGALCGSHFINEEFIEWLKQNHDVPGLAAQLGLSEANLIGKATTDFERVKRDFVSRQLSNKPFWLGACNPDKEDKPRRYYVHIEGVENAVKQQQIIPLSEQKVKDFFDVVIEQIIVHVRRQLGYVENEASRPNQIVIAIPSGVGKSDYIRSRLTEEFERESPGGIQVLPRDSHKENTISLGAIMRFSTVSMSSIPLNIKFGIAREEDWNPDVHVDATYVIEEPNSRRSGITISRVPKEPIARKAVVTEGTRTTEAWVVDGRLHWILNARQRFNDGDVYEAHDWQVHYCKVPKSGHGLKPLTSKIYCADADVAEHAPLFPDDNIDHGFHPGVYEWCDLWLQIDDPSRFTVEEYDGTPCYVIYTQIVARCHGGASIEFAWRIGNEKQCESERTEDVPMTDWSRPVVACSTSCNPFPRQNFM